MSPDNGRYIEAGGIPLVQGEHLKPKPGDRFLGETLVVDGHDPKQLIVDQVEVHVTGFLPGGRVAVDVVALADGNVFHNEGPVSEIVHQRFGIYDLTKKLGGESAEVPANRGSYWRAEERAMGLRRR